SAFGISAIFASTSLSPSALFLAAFSSRARSFIAARSSAVNRVDFSLVAVVRLVPLFFWGFLSAIAKHLRLANEFHPLDLRCDRRAAQRSSWMRIRFARGIAEGAVANPVW